jgi:hypothetical protein
MPHTTLNTYLTEMRLAKHKKSLQASLLSGIECFATD